MWWIVWLLLVVVFIALMEIPYHRALRPIYTRGCAAIHWRRQFPDASVEDIREFLKLFVDAFGFPQRHRLRFRPDDKVMDLYQALNPPDWTWCDVGEIESLIEEFQQRYEVDLTSKWREDLTLGEVFSYSRPA